jgi:hypothetical protein
MDSLLENLGHAGEVRRKFREEKVTCIHSAIV